ncbi:MAG: AAA family ATPase [Pseudomonadota bacterium]
MGNQTVIAVCGKGGVGKTVFSGAVVRVLAERGLRVLAVDADPALGLSYFVGLSADIKTLGQVRDDLIQRARRDRNPEQIAGIMDYLMLEALTETENLSFLAMGRPLSRGCFCPLNTLLKESVKNIAQDYDVVLLDAEAGIEQINREVMSVVDTIVVLVDNSLRSRHSMDLIVRVVRELGMKARLGVVLNRRQDLGGDADLSSQHLRDLTWGVIPEDEGLLRNDALGRSVFDLPADSPILESVRKITDILIKAQGD